MLMEAVQSALVSAFRLILGAHFLSDIAFSAFATILLTLAGRRLFRWDS